MAKGYVSREELRKERDNPRITDYWFTSNPKSALHWESKEEADCGCRIFEQSNIEIPSAHGGLHVCRGFKSEELRPGHFVVFRDAPFMPASATAAAQ